MCTQEVWKDAMVSFYAASSANSSVSFIYGMCQCGPTNCTAVHVAILWVHPGLELGLE